MKDKSNVYVLVTILTLLALAAGLVYAGVGNSLQDDGGNHPPPASGTYNYNGFVPAARYADSVFGTTVFRITGDHRPDDIYSHNKVWSADGTRYLHLNQIINVQSGLVEYSGIPNGAYSYDRGFDPVDRNVLYYQQGPNLRKITLQSGSWTDTIYFTAPNGASLLSLGGEADWLDAGGRYMVIRYGPEPSVYLYDRQNMNAGPYVNPINGSPYIGTGHHVGISPDGKYLVGGGASTPPPGSKPCATGNGWGGDAGFSWRIMHNQRSVAQKALEYWSLSGAHMDYVSASDGRDYAIVSDYWTPDIWLADITNNAAGKCADQQHSLPHNKRLLTGLSWNDARHITAVARGPLRDYGFVSTEDATDVFDSGGDDGTGNITPWRPYRQEIIAINVLTGQISRVAHHRSRSVGADYAYEPRVSVSWGGEYVGWASNFNEPGIVDVFAIPFGSQ